MSEVSLKFLRFHCLDRHHCAVHYRHLVDRIVRRFEEANAGVAINSTVMRNWYQLMYTLHRDLPKEDGPDVFHTCGGGELQDLVDEGLVYDLSRELDNGWREHFVPAAWHPLRFDGKEYAVPLEQGFVFIWYNKKIFERLALSVPTRFEELLAICAEVRRAGIVPFAVGNKERWPGAFFFSHLFHRIGGEEVFVPDFTVAPNYGEIRDSFIAAAEGLLSLVEAGTFDEHCDSTNYQEQRLMFAREAAAMQLNGNRLLSYLKEEGPAILDHVGVFPFPNVKGGRGTPSTIFGGSLATYAISARSKHRDAAVALLRALTDAQAAREVIFDMGDVPAPNQVAYEDYPSPLHGELARMLGRATRLQVHFFKYLAPQPAGVYLNGVAGLLKREVTPEEAFRRLEEALVQEAARKGSRTEGQPR